MEHMTIKLIAQQTDVAGMHDDAELVAICMLEY